MRGKFECMLIMFPLSSRSAGVIYGTITQSHNGNASPFILAPAVALNSAQYGAIALLCELLRIMVRTSTYPKVSHDSFSWSLDTLGC